MWRDNESGVMVSEFGGDETLFTTVPEDESIDISAIENAIEKGTLILVNGKQPKPKKTKKSKTSKTPTGDPKDLIKMSASTLIKRIIPKIDDVMDLQIMMEFELQGKNGINKPRKTVIKALMTRMKKRGATLTRIFDIDSGETLVARDYYKERGHKKYEEEGAPYKPVADAVQEEKAMRKALRRALGDDG
jgi:hypothetical protein